MHIEGTATHAQYRTISFSVYAVPFHPPGQSSFTAGQTAAEREKGYGAEQVC